MERRSFVGEITMTRNPSVELATFLQGYFEGPLTTDDSWYNSIGIGPLCREILCHPPVPRTDFDEAIRLLRELEFSGNNDEWCPICGRTKTKAEERGHRDTCVLGNFLEKHTGAT